MSVANPPWLKKTTPCPFYKTGRCHFQEKCNFIHDGDTTHRRSEMRAYVPAYRRTPENSVDSFSSSEDDDDHRVTKEPIDEHTAAAPSLIFSSIYGPRPNSINRLQLADVDLPVSPESLPVTPVRRPSSISRPNSIGQRRLSSGQHSRASAAHTLNVSSPVSSRAPSRPVSASLGIGLGGRAQGLAEVFTALAATQAQTTVVPPASPGSLPSPLSLSPKSPSPPLGGQDLIVQDGNFTLEQFPFKLALSNQSSLLLNRTTRAAARENTRRASSYPLTSASPSPASKRPTHFSAPDRYSISSSSYRPGTDDESFERPVSYSRSGSRPSGSRSASGSALALEQEQEEEESFASEEEDEDDGYGEDEPQLVQESSSFEALQPYPRDVSIEPSPEPGRIDFESPTAATAPEVQGLRKPPPRMDSARQLDHELLLAELEERLGVEPGRRRARSGGAAALAAGANAAAKQSTTNSALGIGSGAGMRNEPGEVIRSGVDMDAARGMLGAMFAKRAGADAAEAAAAAEDEQEAERAEREQVEREQEAEAVAQREREEQWERDLEGSAVEEEHDEPDLHEDEGEDIAAAEIQVAQKAVVVREGSGTLVVEQRQQSQGDEHGLGSESPFGDQSFLPTDWDIGSMDFGPHPADLDVQSVHSDSPTAHSNARTASAHESLTHRTERSGGIGERDALVVPESVSDTEEVGLEVQETRSEASVDVNTRSTHSEAREIHSEAQETHLEPQETQLVPQDIHSEHTYSDHHSEYDSDHFSTDEEPPEDYAELIEEQAIVTSPIVLRRETPRETSLPEIEATRARSRAGSLQSTPLAGSLQGTPRAASLARELLRKESMPTPLRQSTLREHNAVFEVPQVEAAPPIPDAPVVSRTNTAPGVAAEDSPRELQSAPLSDVPHAEPQLGGELDHPVPPIVEQREPSLDVAQSVGPISDNTPIQPIRTPTIPIEAEMDVGPLPKPRPRSQLKPLRLSIQLGLGTPTPRNVLTPVSAHSGPISAELTPKAFQRTPSTAYPTPATAHPARLDSSTAHSIPGAESIRSAPHSARSLPDVEEVTENVSTFGVGRGSLGPESVSWYGSKGSGRGSLSGSMRSSLRGSEQRFARGSEGDSVARGSVYAVDENLALSTRRDQSFPPSVTAPLPEFSAPPEDEDVRPLPVLWDDETDGSPGSSSSHERRTQLSDSLPAHSPSIPIPVLEVSSKDTLPNMVVHTPPPNVALLASPTRSDSVPRYPAFVSVAGSSPRSSAGRSPLPSPSLANSMQGAQTPKSKASPPTRTRKWADDSNEDSIGSLPVFDTPVPVGPPSAPRSERLGHPRHAYPPLPNTAPLSISPRNVSPSMYQHPYEQELPLTAPLASTSHLRLKMLPQTDAEPSPWMSEHFVNSPSSLHSSQLGSLHSNSSSLSTRSKGPAISEAIVIDGYTDRSESVRAGTFGNPGPGPSTMMTYSARRQSAEALASPIVLQSPRHARVASLSKEPEQSSSRRLRTMSRRISIEVPVVNAIAEPERFEEEPTLKISPAEPTVGIELSARSPSLHDTPVQTPVPTAPGDSPPTDQVPRFKPLSSPNARRSPMTPLTAPSPLQILRRNMMARPGSESPGFVSPQPRFSILPGSRSSRHQHHGSLAPIPSARREDPRNMPMSAPPNRDRRSLTPAARFGAVPSRPGSPTLSVQSVMSQTKPLLFFAIAKNSAQEVERLLQVGEAQPNDKAGPEDLPALAFTLANEQLTDKTQIVKSLLSHGADPASVLQRKSGSGEFDDAELALSSRIEQGINPAIRYYLNRKRMTIPAPQAELLEKNNFGALTRAGFSIIGQDSALDELIRVVAGHCRRQTLNPLVIVFSGGPGCGKSLLASKIGPLLHVPTFTVNMTNLRNESSLFNYISMTTKAGSPQIPLVDFLKVNEGRRCVVVLEEIEKAADKTVWHSLLMPWEWGKATVISPASNDQIDIDTSQVIWIATSNSGDDATLKFFAERSRPTNAGGYGREGESALARLAHSPRPADNFTRKDYLQLMQAVRKRLGELLGSSMISRVSSVLPFLPFTEAEVLALASESLSAMREDQKTGQDVEEADWDSLLQQAVGEYIPGEGARSVHRAVQRAFDEITEW